MKKLKLITVILLIVSLLSGCASSTSFNETTFQETSHCTHENIKNWKVAKEATCQKFGYKEGVCEDCGYIYTTQIDLKECEPQNKWIIEQNPSFTEDGWKVKYCKNCGDITDLKEITLSKKERITLLKNECKTFTYEEIARNPKSNKGKYAKFTGEVIQILEYDDETILRVNVTKQGIYTTYYSDTVYVTYSKANNGNGRILEDDIITMYGILQGTETYESTLGSDVTIPSFEALYIEIN